MIKINTWGSGRLEDIKSNKLYFYITRTEQFKNEIKKIISLIIASQTIKILRNKFNTKNTNWRL